MKRGGPCAEFGNDAPRVYIAAPIFTASQLEAVQVVCTLAETMGYVTYSPARDGIMLAPNDPPARRDEVFASNVWAIRQSDLLIALLDTKDTGTIWELGAATGLALPIVAVTLQVPRMNVMLERGVLAHVRSEQDLGIVLEALRPQLLYGRRVSLEATIAATDVRATLKEQYSYSGETQ